VVKLFNLNDMDHAEGEMGRGSGGDELVKK